MRPHSAAFRRKSIYIATVAAVFAATLVSVPAAANAADRQTLTVVGTSDVFDSNLVQSVIEPGFEAAYPQYDLKYVSLGTSAAIAYAKAGTADALIVHAASLENQFVADGYSTEAYGRAIFWGDYVLVGSNGDSASISATAGHDVVTAFEKVAAGGAAGTANFVSRASSPGTTVQEHAIWALTSGVTTCTLSAANGGGATPSTTTGPCPATVTYPSWYHSAANSQAGNIVLTNTCNFPGGNCYALTDRGTFNYLESQNTVPALKIVTRDNLDTARGTSTALVNSFHAYGISQAKIGSVATLNTAGAASFLSWITSPAGQSAVGAYLSSSGDAPFIPSAAPNLTATALPGSVLAGGTFTVSGKVTNVTPGTPALAGVTVSLNAVSNSNPLGAAPAVVATTQTDAAGNYVFTYAPPTGQFYSVSTGTITQIENSTLDPVFGDLLAPTEKTLTGVTVTALPVPAVKKTTVKASISTIKVSKKYSAAITVKISPKAAGTSNVVKLYGRNSDTKTSGLHLLKTVKVKAGATSVTIRYSLGKAKHSWKKRTVKLKAVYSGPTIVSKTTTTKTVKLR